MMLHLLYVFLREVGGKTQFEMLGKVYGQVKGHPDRISKKLDTNIDLLL